MRPGSIRCQLLIIRFVNASNRASPCSHGGCDYHSPSCFDHHTYHRYTNNCRRNHERRNDRHNARSYHSAPDHKSAEQNNTRYSATCNDGPCNACSNFAARSHYTCNNTSIIFKSRRL
jgi:hypothetical protein